MKKILTVINAFLATSLFATASVAQTGVLAFQGVKVGDCQSVRVFGEDSNGDFLFMSADMSNKADNYQASKLVSKSFPAGKTTLERVECFSRRNKNLHGTPKPGGILSDPYVDLKSPLAVIDLKAGETVYLGALELHKLGWGAGLIAHDLKEKVTLPAGARTELLEVSYDVEKTLGNALKQERSAAETSKLSEKISESQAPAPADNGKGQIGLYFKSDGLECNSAEIIWGRDRKGTILKETSLRVKVQNSPSGAISKFETMSLKSGRKHILDVICNTDGNSYSLVPRNQYGNPKFDWESKGQFDLKSDSRVFLGTLTLAAKPIGNMSEDMAKKLGYYAVNLETDLQSRIAPETFAPAETVKLTQFQRILKEQKRRAEFDTDSAQKFQEDLKLFLQIKSDREIEGPKF